MNYLVQIGMMSQRRACRLVGAHRSVVRHRSQRADDTPLREWTKLSLAREICDRVALIVRGTRVQSADRDPIRDPASDAPHEPPVSPA